MRYLRTSLSFCLIVSVATADCGPAFAAVCTAVNPYSVSRTVFNQTALAAGAVEFTGHSFAKGTQLRVIALARQAVVILRPLLTGRGAVDASASLFGLRGAAGRARIRLAMATTGALEEPFYSLLQVGLYYFASSVAGLTQPAALWASVAGRSALFSMRHWNDVLRLQSEGLRVEKATWADRARHLAFSVGLGILAIELALANGMAGALAGPMIAHGILFNGLMAPSLRWAFGADAGSGSLNGGKPWIHRPPGWSGYGVQFSAGFVKDYFNLDPSQQENVASLLGRIRDGMSDPLRLIVPRYVVTGVWWPETYRVVSGDWRLYFTFSIPQRIVTIMAYTYVRGAKETTGEASEDYARHVEEQKFLIETNSNLIDVLRRKLWPTESAPALPPNPVGTQLLLDPSLLNQIRVIVFDRLQRAARIDETAEVILRGRSQVPDRTLWGICYSLVDYFEAFDWDVGRVSDQLLLNIPIISSEDRRRIRSSLRDWMTSWLQAVGQVKAYVRQSLENANQIQPSPFHALWFIYYELHSRDVQRYIHEEFESWARRQLLLPSAATETGRQHALRLIGYGYEVLCRKPPRLYEGEQFTSRVIDGLLEQSAPDMHPADRPAQLPPPPVDDARPSPTPIRSPDAPPVPPEPRSDNTELPEPSVPWRGEFKRVLRAANFPADAITENLLRDVLAIVRNTQESTNSRAKALKALLDNYHVNYKQGKVNQLVKAFGDILEPRVSGASPALKRAVGAEMNEAWLPFSLPSDDREAVASQTVNLWRHDQARARALEALHFSPDSRVLEIGGGAQTQAFIAGYHGAHVLLVQGAEESMDDLAHRTYDYLATLEKGVSARAIRHPRLDEYALKRREMQDVMLRYLSEFHRFATSIPPRQAKFENFRAETGGDVQMVMGDATHIQTMAEIGRYMADHGKFTHIVMTDVIGSPRLVGRDYVMDSERISKLLKIIAAVADPSGAKIYFSVAIDLRVVDHPDVDPVVEELRQEIVRAGLRITKTQRLATPGSMAIERGYLLNVERDPGQADPAGWASHPPEHETEFGILTGLALALWRTGGIPSVVARLAEAEILFGLAGAAWWFLGSGIRQRLIVSVVRWRERAPAPIVRRMAAAA